MDFVKGYSQRNPISDREIAIFGGVNAFNGNYDDYVEALHPGDEEAQDNILRTSKDYYTKLENILLGNQEPSIDISNISDSICEKVSDITLALRAYIK